MGIRDTEMSEGINLTDTETGRLAHRIVARRIADYEQWLEWEDYPELGEFAFHRLVDEVAAIAAWYREACGDGDRTSGIDSLEILERVS